MDQLASERISLIDQKKTLEAEKLPFKKIFKNIMIDLLKPRVREIEELANSMGCC